MTNAKHHSAKKLTAVLLVLFLLISCMSALTVSASAAGGFYVSGTTICDSNGNAFEMRGVNIPHAWYSSYTETSIKGAAALGANTVRIVLGDGQKYTKTSYSEVSQIIDWCKQYKVICILEVHDATGSDSTSDLNAAVNYWKELKNLLNANTDYVILNIANEWFGSWDGYAWAEGNKSAIKALRNAGINNMIMVDSAGWGQYPDSIKNYGKSVFNADTKKNTVFSIHMYEYAGGNANTVKTNIDNALSTGVPVVIGEFGGQHTDGDVDEYTIMSYCERKGVGYLGWSWKGNSGGLDYLDIANSWDGSSLSTWGNTLFYDANGISKTASVCSVYGGSSSGGSSSSGNSSSGSSSSGSTSGSSSDTSASYTSLFYGSAKSSNWGQAVSVATTRAGGSFDASAITSGGHFYVEYKGTEGKVELILQSWSGGSSWGKVTATETGTANGNYFAKYSYDSCVSTFGSKDFASKLDMIHVGAMDASIEVISVCYDKGNASSSNNTSSNNSSSSNNTSNNTSSNNTSNNNTSSDNTSSDSAVNYTSLFYGSAKSSNWGQAVSVGTTRAGGSFDASAITPGGHFYVEYKGTQGKVELILQSWSGASSWGKVTATEAGTANGNYYVKYSYDSCVSAFGSKDFANKLDRVHVGAMDASLEVVSVCYDKG